MSEHPYVFLPTLNAFLNSLAAVFLFLGWRAIKSKDERRHRAMMINALVCSALFLISYLTYHALAGVTHYTKTGILKKIYFAILLTHTPLATVIVPFSLLAIRYALKRKFKSHTRITKWLFPVWMYVSFTGVLIYFMLYVF